VIEPTAQHEGGDMTDHARPAQVIAERHQRLCAWAGVSFAPVFLIGFWFVAGFIPPPSPGMDAGAVARLFIEDRDRIRVGMWIACAAAPLLAFFVAAVSHQLRQIAGPGSPLVTAQTIAGSCLLLEFLFPQFVWQTATYRAERDPAIVQTLNDLAWLPYVGIVGTAIVQAVITALVVLQDRRPKPVLPRWLGYLSLWAVLGMFGGAFVVFAKSGPLAWDGLIAWYLLVNTFFVWMAAMTWQMLRASHQAQVAAETAQDVTVAQHPDAVSP
jgi:hypothetical protein